MNTIEKTTAVSKFMLYANNFESDWLEKAFDSHMASHLRDKFTGYCEVFRERGIGGSGTFAFLHLYNQLDVNNRQRLIEYIDEYYTDNASMASAPQKPEFIVVSRLKAHVEETNSINMLRVYVKQGDVVIAEGLYNTDTNMAHINMVWEDMEELEDQIVEGIENRSIEFIR